MKTMRLNIFLVLLVPVAFFGSVAFASPSDTTESANAPASAAQTNEVPKALRPALYRALGKDAGHAYSVGKNGCVTLPKQAPADCFGKQGTRFNAQAALGTSDPTEWIEHEVTRSDGASGDVFSYEVAVVGTTALVSAPGIDNNTGAVYVFTESNGTWSQTAELTASDGASDNYFGYRMAFDGTTALIGAPMRDNFKGAVYVFTKSNGTWSQAAELTVNDDSGDFFGWGVALDGTTAMIGAFGTTVDGNSLQGAVYVFESSNGAWSQTAELTASDGQAQDSFGQAIALDGTTALIGAQNRLRNGTDYEGAVYVFTRSGDTWSQAAELTGDNGPEFDLFGSAVFLKDTTALIGAPGEGHGVEHSNEGAAYVFKKSGDAWSQAAKLTPVGGVAGMQFGNSVALDGMTALIGAFQTSFTNGNIHQGAAFVFSKSGGTWTEQQLLIASDGGDSDFFGHSVALDGATALIGSENGGINDGGAAYFYGRGKLSLSVSAPHSVPAGQQYVSQTIATNLASSASPVVSANVPIPSAASFVSASATQGSCSEASGVVTCDFGQIPGNAGMTTASVTLKATGAPGTTIENTASIAKATPALMASAPTEIGEASNCEPGYREFDGHLDDGEQFLSEPIEVNEAGQKYVDLTAPTSFKFVGVTQTRYGEHTYIYRKHHGHRWGATGSYQVGVRAGDTGGDYTLCVQLNP
jgi:hypothetical protein